MSADKKYHAVVIPEAGEPYVKSFATPHGLADHVRKLPPTARGHLFVGDQLFVSAGRFRFLLAGDQQIPLFDQPEAGPADTSDRLGFSDEDEVVKVDPEYGGLVAKFAAGQAEDDDDDEDDDSFGDDDEDDD